ncbi:unnamed protein product [Polarella glacialis]|uniref:ABC transmembrane type-1 domain-containing protein n=1 Tax=Polarella glacialis TaxID=89957 RepID=A0A813IMM2_POLGL|nr:unnamed protein product [Polarella glacialis]
MALASRTAFKFPSAAETGRPDGGQQLRTLASRGSVPCTRKASEESDAAATVVLTTAFAFAGCTHRGAQRRRLGARRAGRIPRARRRARSGKAEETTAQQSYTFDGALLQRFLKVAEPYFQPEDPGPGGFGILLLALVVAVAAGSFLLFLAGLDITSTVPALAALVPAPGASAKLAELATPGNLGIASASLAVSSLIFAARREDLAGRWQQWGFLALLVFLLLCVTGINVLISYVFRTIDNVLVAKNEPGFYMALQLFVAVLVVVVPVISGYRFARLTLARKWREFLTVLLLDRYFRDRAYYLLDSNSSSANIDNPDQRISEDIDFFTTETLGFLLDILGSISNLISFSAILWGTSQNLTYALILYAVLGTGIALAVGGELIGINYKQLRNQADFRYSLVHIRDNAEAIAFYQGENREKEVVKARLQSVLQNYDQVIQWTTGLTVYQKIFFYVARLVPYFVVGGLYFAGKVDFGTLGQVTFAFSMVLSSVTLIVSRIQEISRFSAGVNRLATFYEALEAFEQVQFEDSSQSETRIISEVGRSDQVERIQLETASALLITEISDMFFLPQKPYMPLGNLRTQLLYPNEAHDDIDDATLIEFLSKFGLGDLPSRFEGFETTADWTRVLSLGEQQRLAATRCLVAKPKVAVLDEATSALPVADERNLYHCLQEQNIGYVSVGHRMSLVQYHDVILELIPGGTWRIMSPRDYEAAVALSSRDALAPEQGSSSRVQ